MMILRGGREGGWGGVSRIADAFILLDSCLASRCLLLPRYEGGAAQAARCELEQARVALVATTRVIPLTGKPVNGQRAAWP